MASVQLNEINEQHYFNLKLLNIPFMLKILFTNFFLTGMQSGWYHFKESIQTSRITFPTVNFIKNQGFIALQIFFYIGLLVIFISY